MRYSRLYWTLMLFRLVSLAWTINAWELQLPTICAFGCTFTFIFFWVAQMLPDEEKYKQK